MHRHFILHKPYGYLSQFTADPLKQKKKKVQGELYDFPEGTMAIGRLDEDSEGLLLLTTDGKMSELIRGKHIEKEYYAQLDGVPTDKALQQLREGFALAYGSEVHQTRPCRVVRLEADPGFPERSRRVRSDRHGPTNWVSITLTEGKYRQVRKMTAAVGFPTLRLVRVRVGNLHLQDLAGSMVQEVATLTATGSRATNETPASRSTALEVHQQNV